MTDLDVDTIAEMVRLVDPDLTVRDVTPAERGFCRVYRLAVTSGDGEQVLYLKATPGEGGGGIPVDARLLALLGRRTAIPVPAVPGAVDEHDRFPAPFYLMTAMPGRELPYEQVAHVPDDTLETTARQVGTALGDLHGIEGLSSFGHVTHDPDRPLAGGRPPGTVADLTVDGVDSWAAFLDSWVERELQRHADSRFDDLTPALRSWCEERLADIDDPHGPVLGRNDHGFHNLLVDGTTGEVTAMIDWAYTLAVTPAFDVEYAAYLFSGAFLAGLPDVRDRRDLVRAAMLAGYRSSAPDRADAVARHRPLYELLAAVRVMNDFDQLRPRLPDGSVDAVADRFAADTETFLSEH